MTTRADGSMHERRRDPKDSDDKTRRNTYYREDYKRINMTKMISN